MSTSAKTLRTFILIFIILCVIVYGYEILKNIHITKSVVVEKWETYQVKRGDTLWDIVPRNDDFDTRDIVRVVKEHNDIGQYLYEDQVIELPVW